MGEASEAAALAIAAPFTAAFAADTTPAKAASAAAAFTTASPAVAFSFSAVPPSMAKARRPATTPIGADQFILRGKSNPYVIFKVSKSKDKFASSYAVAF